MSRYSRRIRPVNPSELEPNNKYLLTREGNMKDHTGIYTFTDVFNSGECVLYNESIRVHYTIPLIHSDITLYTLE